MEISKGNSLCSYHYLKQAKMPYVSCYLFYLLPNQKTGWQNKSCPRELASLRGWRYCGKGE
jgi:hypothetical protein